MGGGGWDRGIKKEVRGERVKGRGGRRMKGQESKEERGKQGNKTVEDRAVETIAAFLYVCMLAISNPTKNMPENASKFEY